MPRLTITEQRLIREGPPAAAAEATRNDGVPPGANNSGPLRQNAPYRIPARTFLSYEHQKGEFSAVGHSAPGSSAEISGRCLSSWAASHGFIFSRSSSLCCETLSRQSEFFSKRLRALQRKRAAAEVNSHLCLLAGCQFANPPPNIRVKSVSSFFLAVHS